MKKRIMVSVLAAAGLILALSAIQKAEAAACGLSTCYVFDSLKEVASTNFSVNFNDNIINIIGSVGGVEKSAAIIVLKGAASSLTDVSEHCLKDALLAQVSPDKLQLSVSVSVNESSNGVVATLQTTGADTVICSLQTR